MTYIPTSEATILENIQEVAISDYFATINQEQFTQTAALFTETGELNAPFEKPIIGRDAIAAYLSKEAKGMLLLPKTVTSEPTADHSQQVKVVGKVKTPLFSVNVAWHFQLNSQAQITTARIKLLASPQELLGLRNKQN